MTTWNGRYADKGEVVHRVSETTPKDRHWIITAYISRRLMEGEVEWKKN